MKKMTLVCGLPNAGKTTYCKKFENVIHLDDYNEPRFSLRNKRCNEEAIKSETDVYIDGCYFTKELRKELLEKFDGWKKACILIDTPFEVCIARCEENGRHKETVMWVNDIYEKPTQDEGWDEFTVIEYDKV